MIISAPLEERNANNKIALIEDTIPLPPLLQLRSKTYLEQLYSGRRLSVREIAGLTDLGHSVVLAAMDRFGRASVRGQSGGRGGVSRQGLWSMSILSRRAIRSMRGVERP